MLSGKELLKFQNWLENQGAEILPTTNQYEAIRFKGRETGVLYKSGKVSGKYASEAVYAYQKNLKWTGAPVKTKRKIYIKEKGHILDRDGDCCFYCGKPLEGDITLEHLIPLSAGGKNTLSNMVLAHEECNQRVGNWNIHKKVEYAINQRQHKKIVELSEQVENLKRQIRH